MCKLVTLKMFKYTTTTIIEYDVYVANLHPLNPIFLVDNFS